MPDDFGFQPAASAAAPAPTPAAPAAHAAPANDFGFTPSASPQPGKKEDFGFTPTASPTPAPTPQSTPQAQPQPTPQPTVGGPSSAVQSAPLSTDTEQKPWPQWFESSLETANKYLVEPLSKWGNIATKGGANAFEDIVRAYPGQEDNPNPTAVGIARGIGGVAGGAVGDPRNWPFMASEGVAPLLQKLISGGFGIMMGSQSIETIGQLKDHWDQLTPEQRAEGLTQAGAGVLMTVGSAAHVITGSHGEVRLTPEEFQTAQDAVQSHMESAVKENDVAKMDDAVEAWKIINAKKVQGERVDTPAPVPPPKPDVQPVSLRAIGGVGPQEVNQGVGRLTDLINKGMSVKDALAQIIKENDLSGGPVGEIRHTNEVSPDDATGRPYGQSYTSLHDSSGKEVGNVLVGFDGDGQAHINDSGINTPYRNQGLGRQLYIKAIEEARNQGVDSITSGFATSPDAARVWRSLAKDYPVVETKRGPDNEPFFTIDLRGANASGTGVNNVRPATGETSSGASSEQGERFGRSGDAEGSENLNTPPSSGSGAENLRGNSGATGREGNVRANPVSSAFESGVGRETPERLLSIIEPSFQDVLRMGRGEEGPGLADAVIVRGVTGAPPELEDTVETPSPVISHEIDRDLSNGGIKVVKGGEDIGLIARYLGSLSQSARRLNNPILNMISSRIADTTIGIARNTADTLTGFRKEVRRNVTPEEWDKVVTILDDPRFSKGNLPVGTPAKVERAYNYTRDLLDQHRTQARDAKRNELVNGGMTRTRAEQLVPDDWGIKDGYYVHAFPGNWTVTEHGGLDVKGNDIWNPIDTGWRQDTLSNAQIKAEEYLAKNPGAKLKVQLDNISLPGKGITDKNRLQALHDEIKQASAQVYNGANPDQVMGDLKNASSKLNFGPRRVAPKGFGAVSERESNLPGWARDLDNFERYIMGMERYLQMAPARAEIFKYRNMLAKMTNMPDVLKPSDLPKRYSGQMANALGRVDASIEALEGYPTGLDSAIRNSLQRIGMDPNLLNNAYSHINSAEALLKLGFNPASAGLHLAQTIAATYPVLGEKWTTYGIAQAYSSKYASLVHDLGIEATSNLMDIDSYKAYRTGYIKGVTQASGPVEAIKNIAGTAFQDTQTVGLYAFSKGVETARRVAAVGAYEKAVSEGKGTQEARDYARDVLHRTQFNYSAADAPVALRALPRPLTQFKNFTLKMGEFVLGLRGPEIARFLIGMGVIGYAGLPALQSMSKGIAAISGYNPEEEFKRFLPRFSRGALGYAGIDYTKNIGFGDWLGGDSLDPSHLLGPGLSDIGSVIKSIAASVKGPSRQGEQDKSALWNISPEVKRLHDEGVRMATTPSKVDPRTGATIVSHLTPVERLESILGFTPLRVSEERDTHEYIRNQLEQAKDKRGYFIDKLAETQVELSRPDITPQERMDVVKDIVSLQRQAQSEGLASGLIKSVKIRAREMMMDRLQRDLKLAPKGERLPVYNEIQRYKGEVGDASH